MSWRVLTLVTYDAAGALAGRRAARVAAALAAGLTVGQPVPDEVLGIHAVQPAAAAEPLPEPEPHPVSMTVTDELRRSRVLTFFRLPIAIPHIVWLLLWAIVAWLTLHPGLAVRARDRPRAVTVPPVPLAIHPVRDAPERVPVLVGNPFPGFVGKPGSYPVDLELPAPERQKRLVTVLPLLARDPGDPDLARPIRRALDGRVPRLVRRALPRPDARRACATSARTRCATAGR